VLGARVPGLPLQHGRRRLLRERDGLLPCRSHRRWSVSRRILPRRDGGTDCPRRMVAEPRPARRRRALRRIRGGESELRSWLAGHRRPANRAARLPGRTVRPAQTGPDRGARRSGGPGGGAGLPPDEFRRGGARQHAHG